jgi:hypothetical protein
MATNPLLASGHHGLVQAPDTAHLQPRDDFQVWYLAEGAPHYLPERCQRLLVDPLYQARVLYHLSRAERTAVLSIVERRDSGSDRHPADIAAGTSLDARFAVAVGSGFAEIVESIGDGDDGTPAGGAARRGAVAMGAERR